MSKEEMATVHVTKDFPVKKEVLFKAWTEPEQLKQWWKPMNKQLREVDNDIREGGAVRYRFEDGLQIGGTYKEASDNKLVYSWSWDVPEESMQKGEYLLTVQFKDEGDGSSIDITQEEIRHEHAIKPHEDGWQDALNALEQHLSGKTA